MEGIPVLSSEETKALDRRSEAAGVPGDVLMETAGRAVADAVRRRFSPRRVVLVAGKGGNGGDALVAARALHEAGIEVRAFSLYAKDDLAPLTRQQADALQRAAPDALQVLDDCAVLEGALGEADVAIDGLLGIGVDRPLRGRIAQVVELLNGSTARRVAVDLPSGLVADSGELPGEAVRADLTVCMAVYKPAHLFFPARGRCGEIEVAAVGYPEDALAQAQPLAWVAGPDLVKAMLPVRPPTGHKGTFGRVLVVAGSVGMSGAAILCAAGALRAGAGLVTVACPGPVAAAVASSLPEALTLPLPEREGRLTRRALSRLLPATERADVLAIGPGLSRAPAVGSLVLRLLRETPGPIVLDADALFALRGRLDRLVPLAGRAVLTPHPGEFSRLVDRPAGAIDTDRLEVAPAFARTHHVTVLLKGRPTAIGTPDGRVFLNPTGNAGLATGGSGDVLTGIIAGLLAGGASPEHAAVLGAYLHGAAADHLARHVSERSILPSDLLAALPRVLRQSEQER